MRRLVQAVPVGVHLPLYRTLGGLVARNLWQYLPLAFAVAWVIRIVLILLARVAQILVGAADFLVKVIEGLGQGLPEEI